MDPAQEGRVNSNGKTPLEHSLGAEDDSCLSTALNFEDIQKSIYQQEDGNRCLGQVHSDFMTRFSCLQGWFFRCSWSEKYNYVLQLCHLTDGGIVLEQVLKCIEGIYSKDTIDSFARDRINFIYDIVTMDDNRALDPLTLILAKQEDTMWFLTLESSNQVNVILTLLKLGGGGLIFSAYKEIDKLYRERKEISAVLSAVDKYIMELNEDSTEIEKSKLAKVSDKSEDMPDKYAMLKLQQISRRNSELNDFKKKYGLTEVNNGKNKKKTEVAEVVDYIQVLPLWLNRKIMLYVSERQFAELKKTGKYWAQMINEAAREGSGRATINAKIAKVECVAKRKPAEDAGHTNEMRCILRQSDLLLTLNLRQSDLVRIQKENEDIKNRKLGFTVWEDICFERHCCCVSDSCKLMASSMQNQTVHFFSLRTGVRTRQFVSGLPSIVTSMSIHPEGFYIVVGGEDGSLLRINIRKNERAMSYKSHNGPVLYVHTSDERLISGSADGTVKYFDIWSGLCLICASVSDIITSLLVRKEAYPQSVIAGTEEGRLVLIDLRKNKISRGPQVHEKEVIAMEDDGKILVTSSSDKSIKLWATNEIARHKRMSEITPFILVTLKSVATAIACISNQVIAGCSDGKIRLICKFSGVTLREIESMQKRSIKGIYPMVEKDGLKIIAWHDAGIELRHIPHKMSRNLGKKKLRVRSKEKTNPSRIRFFSVLPMSAIPSILARRRPIRKFHPVSTSDREKVVTDRSCTSEVLRDFGNKGMESYRNDILTILAHKYQEEQLKTFPRFSTKKIHLHSIPSNSDS